VGRPAFAKVTAGMLRRTRTAMRKHADRRENSDKITLFLPAADGFGTQAPGIGWP
jgi:hypothetical protein